MTSTRENTAGICVQSLTKRYGPQAVVDDLSFVCEPGTVTGFLGPNGAGKSTTLRILTGLAPASSGSATIGGLTYRQLTTPQQSVGIMLDARALHGGRTGLETLKLAAMHARVPTSRAAEVLERVGLDGAGSQRVRGYSYGMRQRLGIGVALIGDPHVLILDEPANGLDPEGIRWMRKLLKGFAADGGTVLLSSHQLLEVQATVDRLVVIANGRLVRDGTLDEIVAANGTRVSVTEPQRLQDVLTRMGSAFETRSDGTLEVPLTTEQVGRLALENRLVLTSLGAIDHGGLEDVFFSLTDSAPKGGATEPAATQPSPLPTVSLEA